MVQVDIEKMIAEGGNYGRARDYWYAIGIDPGKSTGIALYHRVAKKVLGCWTSDFWGCYNLLRDLQVRSRFVVVIEAPVKTALYANQQAEADKGSAKRGNRMMANVAQNAHEADLLATGLEELGYVVVRKRPKRRNHKTADEDREHILEVTGYDGESNPHTRDAIMLCWGA